MNSPLAANQPIPATAVFGLIAGNGILPGLFCQAVQKRGNSVFVAAHHGESSADLAQQCTRLEWFKVGQVGAMLKFLLRHKVTHLAFAGGIRRPKLFGGIKLDRLGMSIIARARSLSDDVILRLICAEFEKAGIAVIAPSTLLAECVPPPGLLTSRGLSATEMRDAELGWQVAKELGRVDVGQSVVVFDGVVVAVEALEGTDAMLQRSAALTAARGGVLVKVAKPQQDRRLDLPTIGPKTLETCGAAGITAIVVEAENCFLLDPAGCISLANKLGLVVESRRGDSLIR